MSWRPQLWEAEAYSPSTSFTPSQLLTESSSHSFFVRRWPQNQAARPSHHLCYPMPIGPLHFCSSEWFTNERQIRMCLQSIILRGFTFKDLHSWIPRSSAELRPSSAPPPPSPFSFTPPPVSDPKGGII
ncbi:hypothetical protein ILYODFUR_025993 [Ilyodon furcidens]|uniref:Uncharacterized protein n=1 Tax=Ilyodon furcidens TaxID=33524 RepID=A0ABV0TXS5_9TELE